MKMCFGIWVAAVLAASAVRGADPQDSPALLKAYFRFQIAQQIPAQADGLAAEASESQRRQVAEAMTGWRGRILERVRDDLQRQFGDGARARLESFVADYTMAEKSGDPAFLARLAEAADFAPPHPATYAALHRRVTEDWLKGDLDSGAALLGEVQTWLDVNSRTPNPPTLAAWLARGTQTWAPVPAATVAKPSRRDALRDAESPSAAVAVAEEGSSGALETFSQSRRDRRQRAVEEAQAGMQQVASERDAAEREVAARKTAAAQAESEAMKRQSDKLAAAEAEALEQRKDSWSNKLKGIFSATVGAATGAFAGGIGTEAGRRLSESVFGSH